MDDIIGYMSHQHHHTFITYSFIDGHIRNDAKQNQEPPSSRRRRQHKGNWIVATGTRTHTGVKMNNGNHKCVSQYHAIHYDAQLCCTCYMAAMLLV